MRKIFYLSTLLLLIIQLEGRGQSVKPTKAIVMEGELITIQYDGGTGSPTDWIGFYKPGQTPGQVSSTIWQYIPKKAGTIVFENTLLPGKYVIHLFCCDGYNIMASHIDFEVSPRSISSFLKYHLTDDSVQINVYRPKAEQKISIYLTTDIENNKIKIGAIPIAQSVILSPQATSPLTKLSFAPLVSGKYAITSTIKDSTSIISIEVDEVPTMPKSITKIGLGSCGNQTRPQPALQNILDEDIDLFLYLGDNLYIDTYDAEVLRSKYQSFLTNRIEYQLVRSKKPVLATWDDHDYGCCDEDAGYPIKKASQTIFLDFFKEPKASKRRSQEGIYTAYKVGEGGQQLQIIILDTRFFLSDKKPNVGCKNDYCAWSIDDTTKTMLGKIQWRWLEQELLKPADLRMIVSSVQFSSSYHGFESWTLFPAEQKKMVELIKKTKAEGVFFVSGDMHYAEVSALGSLPGIYPLYDFTTSAINQSWPPEQNTNRIGNNVYGNPNIGIVNIDWQNKNLNFTTFDDKKEIKFTYDVGFDKLKFVTGVDEISKDDVQVVTSHDTVYFRYNPDSKANVLKIFTLEGRLLASIKIKGLEESNYKLPRSGQYFYTIEDQNGKKINNGKFIIVK